MAAPGGGPLSPHSPVLCPACAVALAPRRGGVCPRCGAPQALPTLPDTPCGRCLVAPPPWQGFRMHGLYDGALRQLVLRVKFSEDHAAARLLGGLLATACADLPRPEGVVPVPLHPERLRRRGCNQCLELARLPAAALGAPLQPDWLERITPTRPQTGLSRQERRRNLRGAFRAHPDVRGKRILLVDDICTTGTTLGRAVECLLRAGAATVDCAVAARTPAHPGRRP